MTIDEELTLLESQLRRLKIEYEVYFSNPTKKPPTDIEWKVLSLLRCYLSRVENGHTIPSLDTLSKIAGAMEIALSQFFSESGHANGSKGLPQLSDDELRFLSQIRRYATNLNDSDRKLVLAMVKKMASSSGK